MHKYKVALVDVHAKTINQLKRELEYLGLVEVIFTALNGGEYLEKMKNLPPERYPEVVIMDIEMPVMGGIEAVKNSSLLYHNVQYIMFTIADDDDSLFEAIRSGANGYLLKHEPKTVVFEAIKDVIEKSGAPMSPGIARKTLRILAQGMAQPKKQIPATAALSQRETEILKGIVAGLSYKQIADKVFLSPYTVRNHITNIYTKLHVCNKAQAIMLTVNNNWT